jgi:hypothetical protein
VVGRGRQNAVDMPRLSISCVPRSHEAGKCDIRTAQRLGFNLAEIGESLPALWNSSMPQKDIAALLLEKMTMIDRKIEELIGLKKELSERLALTCPLVGVNEA